MKILSTIVEDQILNSFDSRPSPLAKNFLFRAAKNGDIQSLKQAIVLKLDINQVNEDGSTPLMFACQNGHTEAVKFLLEQDELELEIQNKWGESALFYAADENHADIVILLLNDKRLKNPNIQNNEGETCLHRALVYHNEKIMNALLNCTNIDMHKFNKRGLTPLHHVFAYGDIKKVKALCKNRDLTPERDFNNLKILGHFFHPRKKELSLTPNNKKIKLEGAKGLWFFKVLEESLTKFMQKLSQPLTPYLAKLQLIKEALESGYSSQDPKDIVKRIHEKKLTFVPGGGRSHSITLVFFKNIMLVCNRARGQLHHLIEVYSIDPKKITEQVILKIYTQKKVSDRKKVGKFFRQQLSTLLKGEKSSFYTLYFAKYGLKRQSWGNCSLASKKLAIFGALKFLIGNMKKAKEIYKLFSDFSANLYFARISKRGFPTANDPKDVDTYLKETEKQNEKKKSRFTKTFSSFLSSEKKLENLTTC